MFYSVGHGEYRGEQMRANIRMIGTGLAMPRAYKYSYCCNGNIVYDKDLIPAGEYELSSDKQYHLVCDKCGLQYPVMVGLDMVCPVCGHREGDELEDV